MVPIRALPQTHDRSKRSAPMRHAAATKERTERGRTNLLPRTEHYNGETLEKGSQMASEDVTYPPLDVLKPVADNLWIVDSGPQEAMGLSLPVRMTVVRLGSGDVWLHSPTRYNAELRREIETLGPIRHLVAPNIAHWTHL